MFLSGTAEELKQFYIHHSDGGDGDKVFFPQNMSCTSDAASNLPTFTNDKHRANRRPDRPAVWGFITPSMENGDAECDHDTGCPINELRECDSFGPT